VELAADRGFVVEWIELGDDLRLDLGDLERKLDERTRVVACVHASNAVGSVTDVRRVCELAHQAGAVAWIDAVHSAAHERIDVGVLGCDVLFCSAYKFCGPHVAVACGRPDLLESWRAYKARPAPSTPAGRKFETGTPPFELLAGFSATVAYLESLGGVEAVHEHEQALGRRFLELLPERVVVYGPQTMESRVPTFLINATDVPAAEVASTMAARGYGVWAHDHWYALGLRERLPYPDKAVRVGFIHYNTLDEVEGFAAELARLAS
jgi:selenocysteine lyase/cysteine desulfurase